LVLADFAVGARGPQGSEHILTLLRLRPA
jgi:hypothetical protein